jgi:hypothetical protein
MISDKSAAAAVDAVTHIDVITIAASLLVLLIVSVRYIFKINVKIIDDKITSTCEEIDQLRQHCDDSLGKLSEKVSGVEGMAASAGIRVNKLQSTLESTKAVQDAHIDRTDRDIDKLETRLGEEIEKTLKANHTELTKELSTMAKNLAVLAAKSASGAEK